MKFGEKPQPKKSFFPLEPRKTTKGLRGMSCVIHGEAKSGKSTMAKTFPKPLYLDIERGLEYIDNVYSVPIDSYDDMLIAIEEIEKDPCGYETIVVDTVDSLMELCKAATLKELQDGDAQWQDLDHDRRRSYPKFRSKFRYLCERLLAVCKKKKLTLVFVCWSVLTKSYDKEGNETSSQYRLAFDREKEVVQLLGSVDQVFFIEQKNKAVSVYCQPTNTYVAGGRPAKYLGLRYPADFNAIEEDYLKRKEGK